VAATAGCLRTRSRTVGFQATEPSLRRRFARPVDNSSQEDKIVRRAEDLV
jgi:hypothetical protein